MSDLVRSTKSSAAQYEEPASVVTGGASTEEDKSDTSSGYLGGDEAVRDSSSAMATSSSKGLSLNSGNTDSDSELSPKSGNGSQGNRTQHLDGEGMNEAPTDELRDVRVEQRIEEIGDSEEQDLAATVEGGIVPEEGEEDTESTNSVYVAIEDFGEVCSNLKRRRTYAYGRCLHARL